MLVRFDVFQNSILMFCKSLDMGKCRNAVYMPEWNYTRCNLQVNCIATNSNTLSFSFKIILDFDKLFSKTCPCRHSYVQFGI